MKSNLALYFFPSTTYSYCI